MKLLNTNLIAADVWVELYRNGVYPTTKMDDLTDQSNPADFSKYEVVDKIIYINPTAANTLQFNPTSFLIEQDYTYGTIDGDGNTKPLGDHRPVVVTFKYLKSGDFLPEDTDKIDDVSIQGGTDTWFTLDGRKLSGKPTAKGVYVKKGKKVMIQPK